MSPQRDKPAPEYDEDGYIYRGRVIARRPGLDPDRAWSCGTCAALVIDQDRITHWYWHERQTDLLNQALGNDTY